MKLGIVLLMLAGGILAWGYWARPAPPRIRQPIEFPHKTHLDLKLKCTTCHQQAGKGPVAGRPPTTLCLACHSGGKSKSLEVKKIRAFGRKGQEIPWKRIWRLPSHVFFSHRIHVALAKVKCQICHGPMETLTKPPARPLKKLRMNDCIDCHEKRWEKQKVNEDRRRGKPVKVAAQRTSTDCITCHR
ncbi:MAG: cytochrome c3 family protein [Candidatus Binatia bacterium]